MSENHTPGPWEVHPSQPNIVHAPDAGHFIADVFSHSASPANARLITAAPDMRAALQGLIRAGHGLNPSSKEWNAVHAALAKAGAA